MIGRYGRQDEKPEQTIAEHARAEKSKLKKVMGPRAWYSSTLPASLPCGSWHCRQKTVRPSWCSGCWALSSSIYRRHLRRSSSPRGTPKRAASTSGTARLWRFSWLHRGLVLLGHTRGVFPCRADFLGSNAALIIPQWSYLAESPESSVLVDVLASRDHDRRRCCGFAAALRWLALNNRL